MKEVSPAPIVAAARCQAGMPDRLGGATFAYFGDGNSTQPGEVAKPDEVSILLFPPPLPVL